jgi:hypothetical protein
MRLHLAKIIGKIGPEFLVSEAYKLAAVAKQYMEAALLLVEAPPEKHHLLLRPTLALAGHGTEVLLKACISLNGAAYTKRGPAGHDVGMLWEREECEAIRGHTFMNARHAAEHARHRRNSLDVPRKDEVDVLIKEYIGELGRLHGEGGYVLRYTAPDAATAPRAPFLVNTLWRTADDFIKRPNDFIVDTYRLNVLPHL